MNRHALLEARSALTQAIRASAEWTPAYERHQDTFNALPRYEAQLDRQLAEYYLAGLAVRGPGYVDWHLVLEPVQAAATPIPNKGDAVWAGEAVDRTKAVIDAITMLTVTGAEFGSLEYGPLRGNTADSLQRDNIRLVPSVRSLIRTGN